MNTTPVKEARRVKEEEVSETTSPCRPNQPSPTSVIKTSPSVSRPWFDLSTMNGVELIFNTKGIIHTFFSEETKTYHDQEALLLATSTSSSFDKANINNNSSSNNNNKKVEADNHSHSNPNTHNHSHSHSPAHTQSAESLSSTGEPNNSLVPSPSSATVSFSFDRSDSDCEKDESEIISVKLFDCDSDCCDTSNYCIGSDRGTNEKGNSNSISNYISTTAETSVVQCATEPSRAEWSRQGKQQCKFSHSLEDIDTSVQSNDDSKSAGRKTRTVGKKQGRLKHDNYKDHEEIKTCLNNEKILGSYDISEESILHSYSSLTDATSIKTSKTDDSSATGALIKCDRSQCDESSVYPSRWGSVSVDKTAKTGSRRKGQGLTNILNSNRSNSNNNSKSVTSSTSTNTRSSMRSCRKKSCLLGKTKRPSMIVRAPSSSSVRFIDVKPSSEDYLVRARALLNNAKDLRKRLDVQRPNSISTNSHQYGKS